jgi:uncharacterized membrane protein
MRRNNTAPIVGHPILLILVSFPIACFSGALATDIVYSQTADVIWADFSVWLLAAGVFLGALAAIGGIFSVMANGHLRRHRQIWPIMIGSLLVLTLGLFNNLVHSRDAWTSVVPVGLALSAATVTVMLVTVWLGSVAVTGRTEMSKHPGVRQ